MQAEIEVIVIKIIYYHCEIHSVLMTFAFFFEAKLCTQTIKQKKQKKKKAVPLLSLVTASFFLHLFFFSHQFCIKLIIYHHTRAAKPCRDRVSISQTCPFRQTRVSGRIQRVRSIPGVR